MWKFYYLGKYFSQDLLDGLIEQQKALISKIEKGKGTMKQDEKDKVMNLLKELSNSIDKTKEDISNMISVSGLKKRTKAEVKYSSQTFILSK